MVDRWGDFDGDALLNGIPFDGEIYGTEALCKEPSSKRNPPKHPSTCTYTDRKQKPREKKPRASTTTNVAVPRISNYLMQNDRPLSTFERLCETQILRLKLEKLYSLPYQTVSKGLHPNEKHVHSASWMELLQRIAKHYSIHVPDHTVYLHSFYKANPVVSADFDDFAALLHKFLSHFILNPTIAACFDAITRLFEAIIDPQTIDFKPLEDISAIMAPPLSVSSESNCAFKPHSSQTRLGSREMSREAKDTQEENLKRKLRLRKYLSLQAGQTIAQVLPDEAPVFHKEERRTIDRADESTIKIESRNEKHPQHKKPTTPYNKPTTPASYISTNNQSAYLMEKQYLKSLPPLTDPMVLLCCECLVNEAVYWCSPCFTVFCLACWPKRHQDYVCTKLSQSQTTNDLLSCAIVRSKSLPTLATGPPLPLLRPQLAVLQPATRCKGKVFSKLSSRDPTNPCDVNLQIQNSISYSNLLPPVEERVKARMPSKQIVHDDKSRNNQKEILRGYLDGHGVLVDNNMK